MIIAILQARMSSSRLPGKVLKPIMGKPMLALQVERILRTRLIDRLVVATSTDPSDDPVEQLCKKISVDCFRGSLDNVLDRYYRTAEKFNPDIVVRLTGDCPLTDPEIIDATIRFFQKNRYDYVTNGDQESTFPDGLDVEVFSIEALRKAWENAQLPSEKEHVTPYIKKQSDNFKIGNFKGSRDLSGLRWTVDEPEDFQFVTRVYEELYPGNPCFGTDEILDLLTRKPELSGINAGFERNEGVKKSLLKDDEYIKNEKE